MKLFVYLFIIENVNQINFTFSYPYMEEKKVFLYQLFEMEILMDLDILRSPESENNFFSDASVISLTVKKITAETSNLILYICIICR